MANKNINLSKLSEKEILNLRICDLPVTIEGTWLQDCIKQLGQELNIKGIRFTPSYYLADEWLTPDEEPVVGVPFFLAHPKLIKLEKKMMLDVDGGSPSRCMKLLRHETGHAINYAYRLYRRRKWKKIFGQFSKEYSDTYRFRPYSKNFVRHLEDYYAQYHPDEDFAETFAVWLTPGLNWRRQYKGWKAVIKLNYIEELMNEIKDKEPLVKKGVRYWQACKLKTTLKNFYKRKKYFHAENFPDFHDSNLKEIFISSLGADEQIEDKKKSQVVPLSPGARYRPTAKKDLIRAADIIKKYKKDILQNVAKWAGEKKYIISGLLDTLIERCRELQLATKKDEFLVMLEISAYITTLVMNYLYTGGFRKER